tara:strand:- start:2697 stop:3125 length:429 start_codon:yes stop_codon:yes gene_type:complete
MSKLLRVFVKIFLNISLLAFSFPSYGYIEATFEGKSAKLDLVVSNTFETRQKGLMHQKLLEKNSGMIFIWPSSKKHCMWMKNTSLPLSLAYLSTDGRIVEIYDMVPFSEESICSIQKVRMALEVNRGWFSKNQITVGDRINF